MEARTEPQLDALCGSFIYAVSTLVSDNEDCVRSFIIKLTTASADAPSKQHENKPPDIQDGHAAESYISRALYDFLEKPPYLAIVAETPFRSKLIEGKSVWVSLVDFYCGRNEEDDLRCETVTIYDPNAKQPGLMRPDKLVGSEQGTPDKASI